MASPYQNSNDLSPTLWLIDDDPALRLVLEDNFADADMQVMSFSNAQGAWTQLNDMKAQSVTADAYPHAILTDIRMPLMDGLSFSEWLNKELPDIPIIIMTAHSDLQSAIDSYETGAFEYLPKPFDLDEATIIVQKAIQRNIHYQKQNQTYNKSHNLKKTNQETSIQKNVLNQSNQIKGIIGQSVAMQAVYRAIGRLAKAPITVLITGESGTGKELVANALHKTSPRFDKPFIALNMSAIPHDLIESELFGHEKGAFTGATTSRQGRFEQADGGTLFLDEIGDMPFNTQTRLLRVLANGEFFRIGGKDPIKVDVRIISATHQKLENLVKKGTFREDLFYRLNVIRLQLPALRERQEDIPVLIQHFMHKSSQEFKGEEKQIHLSAMQILQDYHWFGNVRQLENACRWLTVMTSGDTVYIDDLPPEIFSFANNQYSVKESQNKVLKHESDYNLNNNVDICNTQYNSQNNPQNNWQQLLEKWTASYFKQGQSNVLAIATPEFERVLINTALTHCKGHKGKASQMLGWGRNTLTRKITQLGLDDRW